MNSSIKISSIVRDVLFLLKTIVFFGLATCVVLVLISLVVFGFFIVWLNVQAIGGNMDDWYSTFFSLLIPVVVLIVPIVYLLFVMIRSIKNTVKYWNCENSMIRTAKKKMIIDNLLMSIPSGVEALVAIFCFVAMLTGAPSIEFMVVFATWGIANVLLCISCFVDMIILFCWKAEPVSRYGRVNDYGQAGSYGRVSDYGQANDYSQRNN